RPFLHPVQGSHVFGTLVERAQHVSVAVCPAHEKHLLGRLSIHAACRAPAFRSSPRKRGPRECPLHGLDSLPREFGWTVYHALCGAIASGFKIILTASRPVLDCARHRSLEVLRGGKRSGG